MTTPFSPGNWVSNISPGTTANSKWQFHQGFQLRNSLFIHPYIHSYIHSFENCSQQKYEHHTPWPAFKNPIHEDSLSKVINEIERDRERERDWQGKTIAVWIYIINKNLWQVLESPGAYKVSCGKCGNPLGHEFLKDGPDGVGSRWTFFSSFNQTQPLYQSSRFWIFSHSLKFVPKSQK